MEQSDTTTNPAGPGHAPDADRQYCLAPQVITTGDGSCMQSLELLETIAAIELLTADENFFPPAREVAHNVEVTTTGPPGQTIVFEPVTVQGALIGHEYAETEAEADTTGGAAVQQELSKSPATQGLAAPTTAQIPSPLAVPRVVVELQHVTPSSSDSHRPVTSSESHTPLPVPSSDSRSPLPVTSCNSRSPNSAEASPYDAGALQPERIGRDAEHETQRGVQDGEAAGAPREMVPERAVHVTSSGCQTDPLFQDVWQLAGTAAPELPWGLATVEKMEGGVRSLGVVTTEDLSAGEEFGPFTGNLLTDRQGCYNPRTWEICVRGKTWFYISGEADPRNWMQHIQVARCREEQNVEAFQFYGDIFFRTTRDIEVGSELRVFYSKDYCKRIGFETDLAELTVAKDNNGFECSDCGRHFISTKSLLRHIRFEHHEKSWVSGEDLSDLPSPEPTTHGTPVAVLANNEQNPRCEKSKKVIEPSLKRKQSDISLPAKKVKGNHVATVRLARMSNLKMNAFYCGKCGKDFASEGKLKEHITCHQAAGEVDEDACGDCGEDLPSEGNPIEHMAHHQDVSDVDEDACGDCGDDIPSGGNPLEHMACQQDVSDTDEGALGSRECEICGLLCGDEDQFASHMQTHKSTRSSRKRKSLEGYWSEESAEVQDTEMLCKTCDAQFQSVADLNKHTLTHKPDAKCCPLCARFYSLKVTLRRHMRLQHRDVLGERISVKDVDEFIDGRSSQFSCKMCGLACDSVSDLNKHTLSHKPDAECCPLCARVFSYKATLRRHMRLQHKHGRSSQFSCKTCWLSYDSVSDLNKHTLSHKPDAQCCPLCARFFSFRNSLRNHMRLHHRDTLGDRISVKELDEVIDGRSSELSCKTCGLACDSVSDLNKHTLSHKPDAQCCPLCARFFSYRPSLRTHMRLEHRDVLGEKMSTKDVDEFIDDRSSHFSCKTCGQAFDSVSGLKEHTLSHIKPKAHCCPFCARQYSMKVSLRHHMRQAHRDLLGEKMSYKELDEVVDGPNLSCKICGHECENVPDLNQHTLLHKPDAHCCPLCASVYSEKVCLHKHMRLAHREFLGERVSVQEVDEILGYSKPLCEICGKECANNLALKHHLRSHDPKAHSCQLCERSYFKRKSLYKHIRNAHQDPGRRNVHAGAAKEPRPSCRKCRVKFTGMLALQNHILSNHPGNQVCPVCARFYRKRNILRAHFRLQHGNLLPGRMGTKDVDAVIYDQRKQLGLECDEERVIPRKRRLPASGRKGYKGKRSDRSLSSELAGRPNAQLLETAPPVERLVCETCSLEFDSRSALKHHVVSHNPDAQHCPFCEKCYKRVRTLYTHIRLAHWDKLGRRHSPKELVEVMKNGRFSCETCDQRFQNEEALRHHTLSHMQTSNPHVCPFCEKGYKKASTLRTHVRIAHWDKLGRNLSTKDLDAVVNKAKPTCETCGQHFKDEKALADHSKSHSQVLASYPCKFCGKTYKHLGTLRVHLRHHHRDQLGGKLSTREVDAIGNVAKPVCKECGIECVDQAALTNHTKSHDPEACQCPFCEQYYRGERSLYAHLHHKHKDRFEGRITIGDLDTPRGAGKPVCEECGIECENVNALKNHTKSHDPDSYRCPFCERYYRALFTLRFHLRNDHVDKVGRQPSTKELDDIANIAKPVCATCGVQCEDQTALRHHTLWHDKDSHPCPFCVRCYSARSSLHLHLRQSHRNKTGADTGAGALNRMLSSVMFFCQSCGYGVKGLSALQEHKLASHSAASASHQVGEDSSVSSNGAESCTSESD